MAQVHYEYFARAALALCLAELGPAGILRRSLCSCLLPQREILAGGSYVQLPDADCMYISSFPFKLRPRVPERAYSLRLQEMAKTAPRSAGKFFLNESRELAEVRSENFMSVSEVRRLSVKELSRTMAGQP